jgi:hypothetical protein
VKGFGGRLREGAAPTEIKKPMELKKIRPTARRPRFFNILDSFGV